MGLGFRKERTMPDDYTPTIDDVRAAWTHGYHGDNYPGAEGLDAEFDRWLAAHDARVRGIALVEAAQAFDAVMADGSAGEVEYRVFDSEGELWASTNDLDEARHYLAQEPSGFARIERAVWVPV